MTSAIRVHSAEQSVRQRIIESLKTGSMSAKDISKAVGIMEKEVAGHLTHINRSIASSGKARLVVEPSECLKCAFVFKKRDRLKTPSRCPVCKSEEITETRFHMEVKDNQ